MKRKNILLVLGLLSVGSVPSALANERFCVSVSEGVEICANAESKDAAVELLSASLQSVDTLKVHYQRAVEQLENTSIAAENQQILIVNSEMVDCVGVGPMKCLQVKYSFDQPEWEYFYSAINGFEFEEGKQYILRVKRTMVDNAPADASSIRYELLQIIDTI